MQIRPKDHISDMHGHPVLLGKEPLTYGMVLASVLTNAHNQKETPLLARLRRTRLALDIASLDEVSISDEDVSDIEKLFEGTEWNGIVIWRCLERIGSALVDSA